MHDYLDCRIKDCPECQELIDYGIIEACDWCDSVGSSESDGFNLLDNGTLLCEGCYNKHLKEGGNK